MRLNKRKLLILILIIILGFIYYILCKNGFCIKCFFHEITNLKCPGCGLTRMLINIIELEFQKAYNNNMLIFCLLPLLLPYIFYKTYIWLFDKEDNISEKIPKWLLYSVLGITILFGILRNLN